MKELIYLRVFKVVDNARDASGYRLFWGMRIVLLRSRVWLRVSGTGIVGYIIIYY